MNSNPGKLNCIEASEKVNSDPGITLISWAGAAGVNNLYNIVLKYKISFIALLLHPLQLPGIHFNWGALKSGRFRGLVVSTVTLRNVVCISGARSLT